MAYIYKVLNLQYSKSDVERGLNRLHLVQVKTTWISNKRDYVQEGAIYRGLQLNLRGLYIIASIDCGV